MGILQGYWQDQSLNIWTGVENAGDSHGFGRIGSITGRKCSRREFESGKLHIFDVERQKAGLWCTAAGSRREAEKTVQIWANLGRSKAGVTKWPGGEIGAENASISGSSPGECQKNGTKQRQAGESAGIEWQPGAKGQVVARN